MYHTTFILLLYFSYGLGTFHRSFNPIRIYGGRNIDISEAPYQVAVLYFSQQYCGGALVTTQHIITAAHCTHDKDTGRYRSASDFSIRAGSTYHNRWGWIVKVLTYRSHPNYNPATLDYDISVFKLVDTFPLSSNIKPVALARWYDSWGPGTQAFVTGWGLREDGQQPQVLQGVYLPIVSTNYCKDIWGAGTITSRMFCAGGGSTTTCSADSGGPLVISGVLAGVVSWGEIPCGRAGIPAVYSSVPVLRDFIDNAVKFL